MLKAHLGEKLRRYRQIGNVLVKYGFGFILDRTGLTRRLNIPWRRATPLQLRSDPERVRLMFEELGPTFIKLGQVLSTRPDVVPAAYLHELEKLQDEVPPEDPAKVEALLKEELAGRYPEEFASFDHTPIASASIAQVHQAVLQDGRRLALKIRRPGIESVIDVDLLILRDIAALVERVYRETEIYQPVKLVAEFEKTLKRELDLILEGHNFERFRENFADDPDIYIPAVYRSFTTRKVLALEYVEGIKINRIEELDRAGLDRKKLALTGMRLVLKQIFEHGFFHGDLHPGNIFALADGRLCYLDFGIVGRLSDDRKLELTGLLNGFLQRNPDKILDSLRSMGVVDEETVDSAVLRREIEEVVDRYYSVPVRDLTLQEIVEEEFGVLRRFGIRIPSDLALLAKTLMTAEGTGTMLDPEFNITEQVEPFMTRWMEEKLRFQSLGHSLQEGFHNAYFLLREFPQSMEAFVRNMRRGYFNVAFEHKGLQNLISTLDKSSNRIAFGLITAALLVSSAMIMQSGRGPLFMGFSALGILGFIVSTILGIWLLISILRGGRL